MNNAVIINYNIFNDTADGIPTHYQYWYICNGFEDAIITLWQLPRTCC